MDPAVDPTREPLEDWSSLLGADGRPLPRLYQDIFSLDYPDFLAFLGTSQLPQVQRMKTHVDAHHRLLCEIARTGELANTNQRNNRDWYTWCDEAAGIDLIK
ncbi:hypothetical protein DOTSEDRAFT_75531 [Dothistroma septosporum NZE10]|uniref:Uncharacterized protein n=1 Tax=Dothistroma septosporum (strain NZE10 / CBS 128990) TaxID=675120 RepID=M2Y0K5_DOTSN|nr:hypothetical protein DOTSEDRAFT_75531 [Dothistroma septosporum NZE10]